MRYIDSTYLGYTRTVYTGIALRQYAQTLYGCGVTDELSYDEVVGRNIQELRKACGLTQSELAQQLTDLGLPFRQQTVVKIEQGQRPARLQEAAAIAGILEVAVDALVDEPLTIDDLANLVRHTKASETAFSEIVNAVKTFLTRQSTLDWAIRTATDHPSIARSELTSPRASLEQTAENALGLGIEEWEHEQRLLEIEMKYAIEIKPQGVSKNDDSAT